MSETFAHCTVELGGLAADRLGDVRALSSVVVAAAGAIGLATDGTPIAHSGTRGATIGAVCRGGHIVLHTLPASGICLVDVVARAPAPVERAVEVIARRLGAEPPFSAGR